jgi:hypothetical protein
MMCEDLDIQYVFALSGLCGAVALEDTGTWTPALGHRHSGAGCRVPLRRPTC